MEEKITDTQKTVTYIYYQGEYVPVVPCVFNGDTWEPVNN